MSYRHWCENHYAWFTWYWKTHLWSCNVCIVSMVQDYKCLCMEPACISVWAIPDKLCPPPIEDVNATYAKILEFHLLFHKIFPEIQSEKTRNFGFWAHVWIISGNPCENKDHCSKTLEIQDNISPKKSGNPTSSMGGGQHFFGIAPSSFTYANM